MRRNVPQGYPINHEPWSLLGKGVSLGRRKRKLTLRTHDATHRPDSERRRRSRPIPPSSLTSPEQHRRDLFQHVHECCPVRLAWCLAECSLTTRFSTSQDFSKVPRRPCVWLRLVRFRRWMKRRPVGLRWPSWRQVLCGLVCGRRSALGLGRSVGEEKLPRRGLNVLDSCRTVRIFCLL